MRMHAKAMVMASLLADSLALGAHWIYDTHQIDRKIGRVDHLLPPLPGSYHKGYPISGLEEVGKMEKVVVFHAGTALKDGSIVTNGGRVLGVTALGYTIKDAIDRAYQAAGLISWNGVQYRRDIGAKALKRLS